MLWNYERFMYGEMWAGVAGYRGFQILGLFFKKKKAKLYFYKTLETCWHSPIESSLSTPALLWNNNSVGPPPPRPDPEVNVTQNQSSRAFLDLLSVPAVASGYLLMPLVLTFLPVFEFSSQQVVWCSVIFLLSPCLFTKPLALPFDARVFAQAPDTRLLHPTI